MKRILCIALILITALSTFTSCGNRNAKASYQFALSCIDEGKYEEAYNAFLELGDYKSTQTYLSKFFYLPTRITYEDENGLCYIDITYNEQGLVSKQTAYRRGELNSETEYTYNKDGYLIKTTEKDYYSERTSRTEYKYNIKGQLTQTSGYSDDETPDYVTKNEYDSKGNLISSTTEDEDGIIMSSRTTYDESGKAIKAILTDIDGDETIYTYSYDENGNLTKETISYREYTNVTNYVYDDKGNLISIGSDENSTYVYNYDETGKLTKIIDRSSENSEKVFDLECKLIYVSFDGKVDVNQDLLNLLFKMQTLIFYFVIPELNIPTLQ